MARGGGFQATQTCRKTFFLRNPGNPSYQIEASSCWTLEWATKAFCLYVIASFRRSRVWMSPTWVDFYTHLNASVESSKRNPAEQITLLGLYPTSSCYSEHPFFVPPSHIRDKTRDHLPGFPIRVVVEDHLQLIGGARVVNQTRDKLLHLGSE